MNFKRGFFRIWIVVSALWVIVVGIVFFNSVREAFNMQDLSTYGSLQVPVPCNEARGQEGKDYENGPRNDHRAKSVCWYDIEKFRAVFPEYRDLSVNELAEKFVRASGNRVEAVTETLVATWKGSSNCDNRTIVDLRDSARDGLDVSRFQTGLGE